MHGQGITIFLKQTWHRFMYWGSFIMVWLLTRVLMRIRVTGWKNIPRDGAFLLICNHISHFDPPILTTVLPRRMSWVVAQDMYAHPAGACFFRGIDAISVDREQTDLRAAKEMIRRLKKGQPVGLFPEGGIRSGDSSIIGGQTIDEAVGGVAELSGVPIVPAVILGTDKLYCRKAWFWRTTIDIIFGQPIQPKNIIVPDSIKLRNAIVEKLSGDMKLLADHLCQRFQLSEKDLPKTAQERWQAEV